jgi:hypothetical protein
MIPASLSLPREILSERAPDGGLLMIATTERRAKASLQYWRMRLTYRMLVRPARLRPVGHFLRLDGNYARA